MTPLTGDSDAAALAKVHRFRFSHRAVTTAEIESPPPVERRASIVWPIVIWLLTAGILSGAAVGGLALRRWVFDVTGPIRFTSDITRGCFWGLKASGPEGYLNQYEKMANEQPEWKDPRWDPWLDYAPLRLLVMRQWGVWIRGHYPPSPVAFLYYAWRPAYAYNEPVLEFNAAMDGLGAVCAFFLTRLWVRRAQASPGALTGWWQAVCASLLLWFNPAIVLSAHGWPTWDEWIVPMYLLAALLASLNFWFCCGAVVAIGAMFKGQQLTVAPIFVIWALVLGDWRAAVRWFSGGIVTFAAIVSPWLLSYLPADRLAAARLTAGVMQAWMYPANLYAIPRIIDYPAIIWITVLILCIAAISFGLRRKSNNRKWTVIGAIIIFAAGVWPWLLAQNRGHWWIGLLSAAAVALLAIRATPRWLPHLIAAVTGAALLMCMSLFHGSNAWWLCGFHFGTIHWPYMIMGDTSNLPGIFLMRFGWPNDVHAVALHAFGFDVTSKQLFNGIFALLLPLAGLCVGIQARRKSRRMLVALVTPWLLFFCFPVQIHERYLLFGAAVAAIAVGQSIGMALLGIFLSFETVVMTLQCMLENGDRAGWGRLLAARFPRLCSESSADTIYRYVAATHPDIGWAVLLTTAIFFYVGAVVERRGAS